MLSIAAWQNEQDNVNFLDLKMTPQQLYNRVPQPKLLVTFRQALRSLKRAAVCSLATCLGQWKDRWNVGPHRVRRRARDLAREVNRGHYDQGDYIATEQAAARTVGFALLWLPGGAVPAMLARYLNRPPLRQCDASVDILQHKIDEYVERGIGFKEAEMTLKRSIASSKVMQMRRRWMLRLQRAMRFLSITTAACLVLSAGWPAGGGAAVFLPLFFAVAMLATVLHAFIGRVAMALVKFEHNICISVDRKVPDEQELMEQVAKAMEKSDDSSATDCSSSEYSSANESFLEENARAKKSMEPHVIDLKHQKVIVRPKACRLQLRFELMQARRDCHEHAERWQRQEPLRHGRMSRHDAMCASQTVSFVPPEEGAARREAARAQAQRSRSLGAAAEEPPELRRRARHWENCSDVNEERRHAGVPALPATAGSMPPRGLVDEFEAQRVFRQHSQELTNADLAFARPWQDTALALKVERALGCATAEVPPKPWEVDFDEALEGAAIGGPPQLVEMDAGAQGDHEGNSRSNWRKHVDQDVHNDHHHNHNHHNHHHHRAGERKASRKSTLQG